ncbi:MULTISPECIES: FMN-binding negative transcriptional regulator [Streptomyces]|uniref:Transcriptional regulator n=1 Tax=Streptomyces venezuelae TaxID=54571 RepID=A0A5P2BHV2_STRVZ|nr:MULTISPECIES: FMN-binding negative transcriptional regulator [Streptomyces]NEA03803.1 FMN-binding negative transcriptional regulator [Streptomyces sp. SID10116]MYY82160.1 FMN-binding negative transcriptional regulator [Streptomyces sp. SID335]MYZ17499.1 FMN-binding negative transcriptional regulator [Streptomyces sp. SID337]NDZ85718.1 FMN-binding negative transcriptional regulator [Streptomyces sp. SID10115]NEB46697.1 FMN-binding negative transcriptional regulator [Streptomyces sp. SID339]
MYVPTIYQAEDRAWLRRIVEQYPLATLVSNGPRVPYATHLPMIFNPDTPAGDAGPEGVTLLGHLNRANAHWDSLTDGGDAQLIFTGPHGYVTPAVYESTPAAPTWNFVSVHLQGKVRPITDFEETLRVVQLTVQAYEKDFGDGWEMDTSLDYFRAIGPAVGAFRFEVESADGMFKLSQEQSPEIRKRVTDRFGTDGTWRGRELAALMREFDHAGRTRESTAPTGGA